MHHLITVTAGIGVGKSSLLLQVVHSLQQVQQQQSNNFSIVGFVQCARMDATTGAQDGYDLILVNSPLSSSPSSTTPVPSSPSSFVDSSSWQCSSDDTRSLPLVTRNPDFDPRVPVGPSNRRWTFNESVFQVAREYVLRHVSQHLLTSRSPTQQRCCCVVVVVDELGWKEDAGEGHWPLIQQILESTSLKELDGDSNHHQVQFTWLLSVRQGYDQSFVQKMKQVNTDDVHCVLSVQLDDEPATSSSTTAHIDTILRHIRP